MLALLFSANAVLVLFFGLIGVAGNSIVTGSFLVATEIAILLMNFRRSLVLVPQDYLFGAFLICIAVSFAINGRTADIKDWELLAISLFAYPVCRLVPLGKIRTGFAWVSAAIVLVGSIVTAMALVGQWNVVLSKPAVVGHDGAAIYFLAVLGFLLMAVSTVHLTLRRTILISILLFLPTAIFAASMVRFTFIAIVGGLCVGCILSTAGQRRYVAIITATVLAGLAAGMVARIDASKFMITYAIQAIRPEPTQTKAAALPPPAGMVAELKAFHKFQADKGFDYVVAAPALDNLADEIGQWSRSPFMVYEDDRPLGPAHAPHADISKLGHGRFSHWKDLGFIISSSDGTNPGTNGRNYWVVLPENHAPPAGMVAALKVFHKFQADEGFDYVVAAPALDNLADDLGQWNRSPFVVYEDDRPLGPAHAMHADISKLGHGRFSHWKDLGFIISSSDGTNPGTNGRNYWVVLPENHAPVPSPVAGPEPGPTKAAEVGPTKASEAAPIRQPDQAAPPAEIIAQSCTFTNDFNSIAIRKTLLRDAIHLVPSAGPFGFGLASFMAHSCIKQTEVHNSILQATVEFGWFGGLCLLLLIGTAGYRLVSIARIDADARFVLCSLVQVTITSIGHGRVDSDMLLFALIGLAVGFYETGRTGLVVRDGAARKVNLSPAAAA
jgi:hypothetical protein